MNISKVLKVFFLVFIMQQSIIAQEKKFTIENCVNQFNFEDAVKTDVGINIGLPTKIFSMVAPLK